MGERGPAPKPYARRRDGRPKGAKSVIIARPPMPRDLPAEARAEWRRVVPELESIGLLATVDRGVLIRYCCAWADWLEFTDLLRQSGKLLKGRQGTLVRNPIWFLKQDAEQTVSELGRQLGLTPAARLRAGVVHERPPQPATEQSEADAAYLLFFEERRRRLLES
jgi:P27 family predicted phage terminase small subunit